MEPPILARDYIREIFIADQLITPHPRTGESVGNLEELIEGVKRIVDDKGAVISYPTLVAINRSLYLGQPATKELLDRMFRQDKMGEYERKGMQVKKLLPVLANAFGLAEGWSGKILKGFSQNGRIRNSKVIYKEEERMEAYLREHFELVRQIVGIKKCFYKPLFSLEGFS